MSSVMVRELRDKGGEVLERVERGERVIVTRDGRPVMLLGRKTTARAYDALIAASAIAHGLPLFTCNPNDFEAIPGLDVRPVPHPDVVER
jgi:prevent-host-death family protein